MSEAIRGGGRKSVERVLGPPRGAVERKDGRTLRRMTIYFPTDLAQKLSVYCAFHGEDRSSAVARAVEKMLRVPEDEQ
jgi:hypothetical protein